jgi:2'-5' RNA ligase
MRLFVAVPAEERLREALLAVQAELRSELGDQVKWERPQNLHLTLKFLGDVPVAGIDSVFQVIRQTAVQFPTAALPVRGLDAFPRAQRPRVLVLSLADPEGVAHGIAERLEDDLATLGFQRDRRRFKPHITLGRAKRHARLPDVEPLLESIDVSPVQELYMDALTVFQSELSSSGATYTVMAEEPLGADMEAPDDEMR